MHYKASGGRTTAAKGALRWEDGEAKSPFPSLNFIVYLVVTQAYVSPKILLNDLKTNNFILAAILNFLKFS